MNEHIHIEKLPAADVHVFMAALRECDNDSVHNALRLGRMYAVQGYGRAQLREAFRPRLNGRQRLLMRVADSAYENARNVRGA